MKKKLVRKDATNRASYKYIQNFKTAINMQKVQIQSKKQQKENKCMPVNNF